VSVRTMAKVWEQSAHAGSELLMLLAIADFADDDGRAFPSITRLAEKCRTTSRYAIKLLDALVASGELAIVKHGGVMGRGGKTNLYRILLKGSPGITGQVVPHGSPVNPGSVVNSGSGSSEPEGREVVHQGSPKPSLNHQEPPVRAKRSRRSGVEQTFDAWRAELRTKGTNLHDAFEEGGLHAYMDKVGLTGDFRFVAWEWFKHKHKGNPKTQKSWPQTFLNYVRNNYGRLWFLDDEQTWRLTSVGKQFAIEHNLDPQMQASKAGDWTKGAT